MSDSPDLLRDAEVLRKLLTECLRRIDRLEGRLRAEALDRTDESSASPLVDPFEQVLPDDEQAEDDVAGSPIRTLHLSPSKKRASDHPSGARAEPPPPHSPASRQPKASRSADESAPPPSGDGSLDPFALLDLSVPPAEPIDAEVYRGMNALLGGLDVTTPDDDA